MFELLTAQEAADFLRLKDPETAKKKLKQWGVQPYYLGRGRGAGYRYIKDEVIEALEGTRINYEKQTPKHKKKPRKQRTLLSEVMDGNMSVGDFVDKLEEEKT